MPGSSVQVVEAVPLALAVTTGRWEETMVVVMCEEIMVVVR